MVGRYVLIAVLVSAACGGSAADHEVLGDRAYVAGEFGAALAEYRLALRQNAPDGSLRAKAAASALRTGELKAAIEEYQALAREDEERVSEATDGLERVARLALERGDQVVLQLAIAGIRELAPGRALGAFGGELAEVLGEDGEPRALIDVLPFAAAAAPDAGAQDSLMYEYGHALRRVGRCQSALGVFEGLVRRGRDQRIADGSARTAAACALALGRLALQRNEPATAEGWFRRAVSHAGESSIGRAAYVGLGDVMFARGDFDGALQAFQRAMTGAPAGDSIAAIARERLNVIGNAGTVFQQ